MDIKPFEFIVISHPWHKTTVGTTPVLIRGNLGQDVSGFTPKEATQILQTHVLQNFHMLLKGDVIREESDFPSLKDTGRQICVCRVGNQIQVFGIHPDTQLALQ